MNVYQIQTKCIMCFCREIGDLSLVLFQFVNLKRASLKSGKQSRPNSRLPARVQINFPANITQPTKSASNSV